MSFRPFFRGGRGGVPMRGSERGRPFHRPGEGHPFRRPDEGLSFHGGEESRPFRGRGRGAYHRPDESFSHHHQDEGGFGAGVTEYVEDKQSATEEVTFRGPGGRGFGQFAGRGSGFVPQQRPLLRPPGLLGSAPEGGLLGARPEQVSVSHPTTRPFRGAARGARFPAPSRAPWRGGPRPPFNQRSQDYKSPERILDIRDEPPVKKAKEESGEVKPSTDADVKQTEKPKPESVATTSGNTGQGISTKLEEKKPDLNKTPDRKPDEKGIKVTPRQETQTQAVQGQKTPQAQKSMQEPQKKTPQQEKAQQEQQKTTQQKTQEEKNAQTQDSKQSSKSEPLKSDIKKPDSKTQERDRSSARDSRDSRDRSRDSRDYRDSRDRDRDRRGRDSGRDDRSRGSGRDSTRDHRDSRGRDYVSSRDQPRSRHDSRDRDYKRSSDSSSDIRKKPDSTDSRTSLSQRRSVQDRDWNDKGLEEPVVDPNAVCLDFYNSDLNLKLDKDCYAAHTFNSPSGFCFCWGGVRSTYGFISGKVCYEVRIVDHLPVDFGPPDHKETDPHVVRVGWSTDATSFQLGEEPDSFGFGGTGKISHNSKFQDYGQQFTKGDVIIAMLDLMAKPPNMSYAKNGRWLGVAFPLRNWPVGDPKKALFPHILSKNCRFEVNFGQREPFFRPPPSFTYVSKVPLENRVRGMQPPPAKADCEMIMIVGLPGAGKTTWALKTASENPDKRFNIIGTDTLVDKMKVMGLPRKHNYQGRWEVLTQLTADCLNKLYEIGSTRRRNYILDQTNVYASARKRKLKLFSGFKRHCAVLQPTDAELERRCKKRTEEDGKYVPVSAILEMKKNFSLPSEDDPWVDEIIWIEHRRQAVQPLVDMYNKQGSSANSDKPSSSEEKQPNIYDRHSLRNKPDEHSPVPSSRSDKPWHRDQMKEERPPWQRKQDDRRPFQRERLSDDRDRSRSPMRRDGRGPPNHDRYERQRQDNSEPRGLSRDKQLDNMGRPDRLPPPLLKEDQPWQQGNNRREPWNRDQSVRSQDLDKDSKENRPWVRDGDRQAPWERNQSGPHTMPDERGPVGGPRRAPGGPLPSDNAGTEQSGPPHPTSSWPRDNRRPPGPGVGPQERQNIPWQQQKPDQKPAWQRDQWQPPSRQPWQPERPGGPGNRTATGLLGNKPGDEFHDGKRDLIQEEPMDIDPEDVGQYGFDEHGRPMPKPVDDIQVETGGLMGRGRGLLPEPKEFGGPGFPRDTVPQREGRPVPFGQGRPPPEFAGGAGRGIPMERRYEEFQGESEGQFGEIDQYGKQERFDQPYGQLREGEARPAWDSKRDAFDASKNSLGRPRPGMTRPPFEGKREDQDIGFQEGPEGNAMRGSYDLLGHRRPEQPLRGDPDQLGHMNRSTYDRPDPSTRGPFDRLGPEVQRPGEMGPQDRAMVPGRVPHGPAGSLGRGRVLHEKQGMVERGPMNPSVEPRDSPYNRFSEPKKKKVPTATLR